jgi:cytochrome P450
MIALPGRNEKYLQHCRGFLRYLALLSGIINLWPRWLKPVIAPIVTIGDRYHYSICEKILRPYIAERMRALERQMEDPSPNYSEPNTSLQWTVNEAYRCWDRSEWTPAKLASRIIVFIIVTFQVTAIALTNAIFDTAASPNAQSFFSKLREESEREFDAEGGTWTLESLSRMTKIDSALRESLRMNGGASSRGPTKEVIAPEGITLPDGTHVPQGVKIGVSSFTIHHDASIYSDPWSFDPFRFSRPCKEDIEDMKQDYGVEVQAAPGEANGIPNHKNEALVSKTAEVKKGPTLVTTSAEFMGFGHGRWAW